MIATMHGGGAAGELGWILGAVLVLCDGMAGRNWAGMPQAGRARPLPAGHVSGTSGRWLSFLFVGSSRQRTAVDGSGCMAFAQYAGYLWPSLMQTIASTKIPIPIPGVGTTTIEFTITYGTFLAMGVAAFAVLLLYRRNHGDRPDGRVSLDWCRRHHALDHRDWRHALQRRAGVSRFLPRLGPDPRSSPASARRC